MADEFCGGEAASGDESGSDEEVIGTSLHERKGNRDGSSTALPHVYFTWRSRVVWRNQHFACSRLPTLRACTLIRSTSSLFRRPESLGSREGFRQGKQDARACSDPAGFCVLRGGIAHRIRDGQRPRKHRRRLSCHRYGTEERSGKGHRGVCSPCRHKSPPTPHSKDNEICFGAGNHDGYPGAQDTGYCKRGKWWQCELAVPVNAVAVS